MKCKKKKRLAQMLLAALTALLLAFGLTGCDLGGNKTVGGDDEPQSIELTMDNYDYYLSIDTVLTSSTVLGGGQFHISSYKVTITGAISGIYKNCSLFYQQDGGESEYEVKLNAAGYATFSYNITSGMYHNTGSISYVRIQGGNIDLRKEVARRTYESVDKMLELRRNKI